MLDDTEWSRPKSLGDLLSFRLLVFACFVLLGSATGLGGRRLSMPAVEAGTIALQEDRAETGASPGTCAECHQDQDRLKSFGQQWAKVYVDPALYAEQAQHRTLACTVCHGGNPESEDPEEACIGIANKDPAAPEVVAQTCGAGNCHSEIGDRFAKSLHSTMDGHRLALQDLLGEKVGIARYEQSCTTCHSTCSDCHMEEPGAHGLLFPRVTSHYFAPGSSPDNCVACHGGTGDTFFGEPGNMATHGPSMMAEAGMVCTDCHGEAEIHGDGNRYPFLVCSPGPHCEDCHMDTSHRVWVGDELRVAPQFVETNAAHRNHDVESVSCVSCHTAWYASCWNCHQGRESKISYDLYLAVNPQTDQIYPAAHSPAAGADWGNVIPAEVGGGWVIKARHSWGEPHRCEMCHANLAVFIEEIDRQAPFVGYWVESRGNAQYVSEEVAQLLTVDTEALTASVHGNLTCADCHAVQDDSVCADCHTTVVDKPADADWSRTAYLDVQTHLHVGEERVTEAGELNSDLATWDAGWAGLRRRYLELSNAFHGDPAGAQPAMAALAEEVEMWADSLDETIAIQEYRLRQLSALLPADWVPPATVAHAPDRPGIAAQEEVEGPSCPAESVPEITSTEEPEAVEAAPTAAVESAKAELGEAGGTSDAAAEEKTADTAAEADFIAEAVGGTDTLAGPPPQPFRFTDLSTGEITSWKWDFGDGQTSTEQNPEHTVLRCPPPQELCSVSLTVCGPGGCDTETKIDYLWVSETCTGC